MDASVSDALTSWVGDQLGPWQDWCVLAGDASARQYSRVGVGGETVVVMDAHREKESLAALLRVHAWLVDAGIPVPTLLAQSSENGWLVWQDLGDDTLFAMHLRGQDEGLLAEALSQLILWQQSSVGDRLPSFGPLVARELALFPQHWCQNYRGLALSGEEAEAYANIEAWLQAALAAQPQVPVHRDYHSRNLMWSHHALHWIDFQDAVCGPISYDVVSLLRDAYIAWPASVVEAGSRHFFHRACEAGLLSVSWEQWSMWLDWAGVQRHLKILGLFPRLAAQGKTGFLADLPRVEQALVAVASRYSALHPLVRMLERRGVCS